MAGWSIWPLFFLITGVIAYSGSRLSRYGDILAEKTGVGRTWMGLVVLAIITSLPELVNGSSAVLWVDVPDIAVGGLLGACVLNVAILAVADLFYPPAPVLTAAERGHILTAAFAVMLLAVATMALAGRSHFASLELGHVGLSTPVLLICYLMAMRATYRYQRRERAEYLSQHGEEPLYLHVGLRSAAWRFGFHALVVIAAAIWLPRIAEHLARTMEWHLAPVGTVFVAAVTTMPELVVTISALRLGAVDLAVGDLLGSLMVNVAILGVVDLIYFKGPLLGAAAPEHAATGLMAILMVGIVIAELIYRPQKKALRWMSTGAFLLAFLYAAHIFLQVLAR